MSADLFENESPTVRFEWTDPETEKTYKGEFRFKLRQSGNDQLLAGRVRRDLWGSSRQLPQNPVDQADFDLGYVRGELAWAILPGHCPKWFANDLANDLPAELYLKVYELLAAEHQKHREETSKRAEEARKRLRDDKAHQQPKE